MRKERNTSKRVLRIKVKGARRGRRAPRRFGR